MDDAAPDRVPAVPAADPSPPSAEPSVEPVAAAGADPGAPPRRHAFLLYNLARLGLLLVALGAFALAGFRGIALLVVSLLVSGAVSYLVLFRLRGAAAVSFASGWRRWNDRLEERTRAEDVD